MTTALSVDRVVRVSINLQPLASARRNFGILLIAGPSDVIDQEERIRAYSSIDGVAADFGLSAPEYQAAELFFAQTPRPAELRVGRWLKTPAPALLKGAILPDADATATAWTGISDGAFVISVGGAPENIEGLDFGQATNMNGVAQVINTALQAAGASCRWEGTRFVLATLGAGESRTISYGAPPEGGPAAGTDISYKMRITQETALEPLPGKNAETPKEAAVILADKSGDWYGLTFADFQGSESITVAQHLDVAAFIEAAGKSRIYGVTSTDTRTLDGVYSGDVATELKALKRKRSCCAYSRNPYAIVSAFARAFTVNFNANRSTITLKFKQLPGITAEGLTESQANALAAKRCNVFAAYDNDTAIFQEGVMSGDAYFDEIHGLDWLQNAVQNECWNLLYQSKTKIPQTDAGVNQILTCIEKVMKEGVNNGLIAPGVWNADGFGQIERGDYLDKGYYLYAQPVADQPQSEREQRKCPPIQCAVKLAGAIHFVDIQIDVNR